MKTTFQPGLNLTPVDTQIAKLETACKWAGLTTGRARQYIDLLKRFNASERTRETLLSVNESFEIVALHDFWRTRVDSFPGLLHKIKDCISKGSTLSDDDRADTSSNRARNDAFTYLVAGNLLSRGLHVNAVDEIKRGGGEATPGDIHLSLRDNDLIVECKRPLSKRKLPTRAKEACKQIGQRSGIVAIDCSAFARPTNKVYECDSEEEAYNHLSDWLENECESSITRYAKEPILGFLLMARLPTMVRIEKSTIVSTNGAPITKEYRASSVTAWVVWATKPLASNPLLRDIYNALNSPTNYEDINVMEEAT